MPERKDHVVEEEPDSDYMHKVDVDRNEAWYDEDSLEWDRVSNLLSDLSGSTEVREIAEYPGDDEGESPYAKPDAAPPEGDG
jgi:hypothetical protein